MKDVQKERDLRNIAIDRVGVRDVNYPITVMDPLNGTQATIASVSMSVLLPHEYRGTYMSRFIETLEEYKGLISRQRFWLAYKKWFFYRRNQN